MVSIRKTNYILALFALVTLAWLTQAVFSATADAIIVPHSAVGANVSGMDAQGNPKNPLAISAAVSHGLRVVRFELDADMSTASTDAAVLKYANLGLTLYPILGLNTDATGNRANNFSTSNFVTDSGTLDTFVDAFVRRYGPGGSYWSSHPTVPVRPIMQVEIGNEPNNALDQVGDNTGLHYKSAGAFAYVYGHAYNVIKAYSTAIRVIVGGLGDYGLSANSLYLDTFLKSQYTTAGHLDSVGFHPYVSNDNPNWPQNVADIETQTDALHQRSVDDGFNGKIDLNEFDATTWTLSSDAWGQDMAQVMQWGLCDHSTWVMNVQPEWWGGVSGANTSAFLPMVDDFGTIQPYGNDYLAKAQTLTSTGC